MLILIGHKTTLVVKLEFLKFDFHYVDENFESNLQNLFVSMIEIVRKIGRCRENNEKLKNYKIPISHVSALETLL